MAHDIGSRTVPGPRCSAHYWARSLLSKMTNLLIFLLFSSMSFAASDPAHSQTDHSNHAEMDHSKHQLLLQQAGSDQTVKSVVSLSIPETTLIDHEGRELKVVADLIQNKVVLLNTIYTSCTTICLPMGVNFSKLQDLLAARIGQTRLENEVALLSISIDPANDTPQRLKAWKEKLGGQPGWTLLTGRHADVDRLLKATGLFTADFVDHAPIALLGRADQGQWTRVSGLARPRVLAQMIIDQLDTDIRLIH